jgi:hypothetical protein
MDREHIHERETGSRKGSSHRRRNTQQSPQHHGDDSQGAFLPSSPVSTTKYTIQMRVSFPALYEGKRLVVYRNGDPGKEICPSIEAGPSGCVENFVVAVAALAFTVNRVADGRPAGASIREVVTLVDQSLGLPDRLTYVKSVKRFHCEVHF